MARLELTLAMTSNPRSAPVLSGATRADGVTFRSTVAEAPDIFWRQLHAQEFDVSEMSMSSLLITIAKGNRDWVGLPVFTQRHFFQTWAWVRTDAGIQQPQDLRGKRVGVPEYQQTAALWTRGILEHDFGVAPRDMDWYMERSVDRSHGAATGFEPPKGVRFQYITADKSIGGMMMNGELDATLLYIGRSTMVDRSTVVFDDDNPKVRRLFPDVTAEGQLFPQQRHFSHQSRHGVAPLAVRTASVARFEHFQRFPACQGTGCSAYPAARCNPCRSRASASRLSASAAGGSVSLRRSVEPQNARNSGRVRG